MRAIPTLGLHPGEHHARRPSPRSAAFVGIAMLAVLAMLVAFAIVVQQAQTRGEHRRAYQQLTGHIMVGTEDAAPVSTARR